MIEALRRLLPDPSREWLVRKATEALVAAGIDRDTIEYDEQGFRLRTPAGSYFLGNLYDDCRLAWPWQRSRIIRDRYGLARAGLPELPTVYEEVRERLLPGVRDSFMFEVVRLQARLDGLEGWENPGFFLGPRLRVILYVDYEHHTAMVNSENLETWGISFDAALSQALENLAARSTQPMKAVRDGLYDSPWHDCYDPARLLLPGILGDLELDGDPVAVTPTWHHLFLTGANDIGGIGSAILTAQKVLEMESRHMSCLPIVRRGGEWVPLELPRGHVLEPLLRKTRVFELQPLYEDQKQHLDRIHEKDGIDVFVASFHGTQRTDAEEEFSSYCVWPRDCPTLLPQTETIAFFDAQQPEDQQVRAQIDWDIAWQQCGHLMKDAGYVLPRFLVEAFPDEEQIAAMIHAQALRTGPEKNTTDARPPARFPDTPPRVDPARRKQLKRQAKQQLAQEAAERQRALAEANPVSLDDPDWGWYHRENTLRERRLLSNRLHVLSGTRVGRDLLYLPLRPSADDRDIAYEGGYFRCLGCSDFIPVAARRRLTCHCGLLAHGPLHVGAPLETPQNAEAVGLLAKAPLLKPWQLWRRLRVWRG